MLVVRRACGHSLGRGRRHNTRGQRLRRCLRADTNGIELLAKPRSVGNKTIARNLATAAQLAQHRLCICGRIGAQHNRIPTPAHKIARHIIQLSGIGSGAALCCGQRRLRFDLHPDRALGQRRQ